MLVCFKPRSRSNLLVYQIPMDPAMSLLDMVAVETKRMAEPEMRVSFQCRSCFCVTLSFLKIPATVVLATTTSTRADMEAIEVTKKVITTLLVRELAI